MSFSEGNRPREAYSIRSVLYKQPKGPKICHNMCSFSEITGLLLIRKDIAFIENAI
jgi:hypothetical protein